MLSRQKCKIINFKKKDENSYENECKRLRVKGDGKQFGSFSERPNKRIPFGPNKIFISMYININGLRLII